MNSLELCQVVSRFAKTSIEAGKLCPTSSLRRRLRGLILGCKISDRGKLF